MTLRDLILRVRALSRRAASSASSTKSSPSTSSARRRSTSQRPEPAEARARARARFGPVPLAADQCRDARGTGFVDDLARDILYAFRTFRRAPLAALTIVATVALGLGLVAVVFTVYNVFLLRVDAVQSPGELFAVAIGQRTGPDSEPTCPFTRRDYEALRRETSVFTDAFAMQGYAGPRRGPSRAFRPCHRELLPGARGPGGARARVAAGRRRAECRPAGHRAEWHGMAQTVPSRSDGDRPIAW